MTKRIRWSDNDRYFGPFTYARDSRHYRPFSVMLGSGSEDYPECRLRLSGFGHTLLIALPAIIKPWRHWVDTSHYGWSDNPSGGYWDEHGTEYGFTLVEGALHLHYGPQTHDSETTKSKCWFLPWRSWRHVRHTLYDLEGAFFADLPKWGFRHKNGWEVRNAIEAACPTASFEFDDFDGERITAKTKIEEREWRFGEGKFKWLSLFRRNKISRSLDIQFSAETGERKGSWKGGTIGHSIGMLPGELHEAAFRRYCAEHSMTFVAPAQGTSASGQDAQQLGAKPAGPVGSGADDAP